MHSNMSRFIKSFNEKHKHITMSSLSSQDTDLDDGFWSNFCRKHRICQETWWFIFFALQTYILRILIFLQQSDQTSISIIQVIILSPPTKGFTLYSRVSSLWHHCGWHVFGSILNFAQLARWAKFKLESSPCLWLASLDPFYCM